MVNIDDRRRGFLARKFADWADAHGATRPVPDAVIAEWDKDWQVLLEMQACMKAVFEEATHELER